MKKPADKIAELQDELAEYQKIRDRLHTRNQWLERRLARYEVQIAEAANNKALLEHHLRCRLANAESPEPT